jgi:hypothetical protein
MKILKGIAVAVAGGLLSAHFAWADASYQETTRITGGSALEMMKMASVFSSRAKQATAPTTSTVLIHGERMVRVSPQATEIIDLEKKTITHIDGQKRQYSIVTFEQLRDAMNRAAEQAKNNKASKAKDDPSKGPDANITFNVKVKETGATKQIQGQEAKEAVMMLSMDASSTDGSNTKGSMALTSDLWMIPNAPGYDEVRQFNLRMAKELSSDLNATSMLSMFNSQPGASEALADLKKETAKMSGIPVQQFVRMGVTANGEPLPPPTADSAAQNNSATEKPNDNKGGFGSLGKALGGSSLGGFMKHKSSQQPTNSTPTDSSSQSSSQPSSAVLLESATELSNFSAGPVDTAAFDIPAGFKEVESPLVRH